MIPPSKTVLFYFIFRLPLNSQLISFDLYRHKLPSLLALPRSSPSTASTPSARLKRLHRRTDVPQAIDMNCSTSTEFEGPVATANLSVVQNATMPNFSTLMRQIEQTIDLKLNSFMDTLKNQTVEQPTDIAKFHETIRRAVMNDVGGTSELNSTFDFPEDPMYFNLSKTTSDSV
jgi:hypothetical protein